MSEMSELYSLDVFEFVLKELKWKSFAGVNPKMKIWLPSDDSKIVQGEVKDDIAVFVPTDNEASDFAPLMYRAVRQLMTFSSENIDDELKLAKLRLSESLDRFQLHLESDRTLKMKDSEAWKGIVDWEQGVDLINGARQILAAGAKTTRSYSRHFANANTTIATNYLESCYMGQTEVGSYVISALIPAEKNIQMSKNRSKKAQSEVKSREITKTMIASLGASQEVLNEFVRKEDVEIFEWGMSQGVSAEILRGISQIIGQSETEVSVSFAPFVEDNFKEKFFNISFTPDLKPAALKGEKILASSPSPMPLHIMGEVVELRRKSNAPNSARIRIQSVYEGKNRSFSMELDEEEYELAIKAHSANVMLSVRGMADRGLFTMVDSVSVTDNRVRGKIHQSEEIGSGKRQPDLFDEF